MQCRTLTSLQLVPAGMTLFLPVFLTILLQLLHSCSGQLDQSSQRSERSWQDVWTYDELQAPEYWGSLHSAWKLCGVGKRQSPIDLQADKLLFDPELDRFEIESESTVSGTINNTGRGITLSVTSRRDVILSEGPLSYKYALHSINLHFGPTADETYDGEIPKVLGSEHTVDGKAYPAEIQLTFYNTELYGSTGGYDTAIESPNGLAILGIFVLIGNETSRELSKITALDVTRYLVYKGSSVNVSNLNVKRLLPETTDYVTYEGSLTTPGCHETVTWIVMNKPLYITSYQLDSLRELLRTRKGEMPARTIGKNYRPTQELRYRTIRTNIERKEVSATDSTKKCPQYKRQYKYKVNRLPRRL